jgi:SRSO17 transposase
MAARDAGVSYDRLQHFIASGMWDAMPLRCALLAEADRQEGGSAPDHPAQPSLTCIL